MVGLIALLVASFALWSAARSDQLVRKRLEQTVALALTKSKQQIPYDQESVAYWDEAVTNTSKTFDRTWIDVNLGVWMYDYFKHDRVYVVNAKERVTYAMADGQQVASNGDLTSAAIRNLVTHLRQAIAHGALDTFEAGQSRIPRMEDLGIIDGRPAIVSVMPLVPHTKQIVQDRGTETLIVSVRFLDRNFLFDLATTYLLDGVRYSALNDIEATEQSYPLTSRSGAIIGYFVWSPKLPGTTILSELLPALAAGLFGIGAAIAFLIRRLGQSYSELATSEAQAMRLAFHDPLTGLPNRTFFNERLEAALEDVRAGQTQLALMFLDLDRFKQVNDTLGHAAGDALIREVALQLSAALKPGDVVARMGGDEFALVMFDAYNSQDVEDTCRRIVELVSKPFTVLGGQAMVGVSIGVAMAPACGTERSELARKADIALYQAKRDGGQRAQFFTGEMSEIVGRRHALEMELRQALEGERDLEVVYQPLFRANGMAMCGVEALARWNHPTLGAVPPLVFVSLAEECGLIDKLGAWVLSKACDTARAWDLETVAVNVSAMQFRRPGFAQRVLDVLKSSGLAPQRLEIEITESTLLQEHGTSSGCLKLLRSHGVRVALDDFGTGYSSLSMLLNLDVDRIKIDRSFVRDLGQSAQSHSIVKALVTMAHAVGVSVTAEGVETADQRDTLAAIGCDTLQGYLLSAPVSALKLVEMLPYRATAETDTAAA
jgi:diguanylate cyclase (GGDEF)-like protein